MSKQHKSGKNRRVVKAENRRDYVAASYYLADHFLRLGRWALQKVETYRTTVNFDSKRWIR